MDCFVRFRDERVKAKGKRGRGPDAPRGACATCVFPRRLFHRFNRRVPSFPLPLVPLRGRRYCSCSPSVSWRDPERKWERFVSKGRKSGGAQTRSPRLSLRHSAGTIPTNDPAKRTRLFPIRENPWAQLSPVGTEREEVREKALSLTGQRNFSIEFFWISCSREGGGCCASSFDTRIDASSRRQQQQQPIAQPTLLNEKQWRVVLFSGGRASDRCAAASRSLFQEDVRLNRESGSVGFGLRRCILTDIPKWPWRDFLKL